MCYLTSRGLSAGLAINNGWYISTEAGDSHTRVVMPATNTRGYVYWQARATDETVQKRYRSPVYSAGDSIIIVWPDEVKPQVVLVEGPMDALAAAEVGHIGVALMGKKVRQDAFNQIVALFPNYKFTIVPDSEGFGDAGGWMTALAQRRVPASMKMSGHKDLAAMPLDKRRMLLG